MVEGGTEGNVGAGEGGEFLFDSFSMGDPGDRVIIGEVEDRQVVVVEGADADGLVMVVGFNVDDGAFMGGVLDRFDVFVVVLRHGGGPSGDAYFGGD